MLTHAARAAAKQPFQAPLVAARGAREGLSTWLGEVYLINVVVIVCNGLYCQWFELCFHVTILCEPLQLHQYLITRQREK